MKIPIILLSVALLSSLPNKTYAQQHNEIETITIAGSHMPISVGQIAGSVTIIDEARIKTSGAIGITDLLRTVAGVNIGQTGPGGSLTEVRFRGSESNHVMVLIDGIAINDTGQGGLTDFSHLLLANIARIEILRGPQSAIWGSNAIAGVISISTKKANNSASQVSANAYWGTQDTVGASANASKQIDALGFYLNASTHKSAGENISREGNEKDAYSNTDFSAGINYQVNDKHKVSFVSRLLNYTADADGYNYATGLVSDNNAVAKGEQLSMGVKWQFAPSKKDNRASIYSHLLSAQYSKQATDNFTDRVFGRSSEGEKLRLLWMNRFQFTPNKWINVGIESTNEDFKQQGATANNDANQNQSNDAISFVSDGAYALTDALSFSASYRYDNNQDFNNAASYRLGATYAINNNWRLFVSQGKAIKNPTFVERFGFFPNSFLGNAELDPEQQKSTELGIEGSFDDTSFQVNWFNATLDNEILGFVFDVSSGLFTAKNAVEESKRQGVEISIQGQIAKLGWQAQYSYLDASQENTVELRRARHSGSISTTYTLNEQHKVYVQADYSGTKFDRFFPPYPEPSQIVTLKSYILVSANYVYTHNENLSVSLRFSNLLDEQYEDVFGYNTDGSKGLLSVKYTL